ncbi:PH domain-containing protein [Candidatus Saccharibacteria bacterium]|nr:PH domain-containing protein [Candidatus Saccharibacteria bacterium]
MDEGLNRIRHERSKKDFPSLKLEDDEFVEFAISRSRKYLMMMLGGLICGLAITLFVFLVVLMGQSGLDNMGQNFLYIILSAIIVVALLAAVVVLMIYRGNKLFITNKHVIQMMMSSPVATSLNIIDLSSVEDASFSQNGLIQKLMHFGTLRLATVGDETTYTFPYTEVSPNDLNEISKLVTEAKKKKKGDEIIVY